MSEWEECMQDKIQLSHPIAFLDDSLEQFTTNKHHQ